MNINELFAIENIIGGFNTKDIEVSDVHKIVKLRNAVTKEADEIREVRNHLLEGFNVEGDWSKHPKRKEIKSRLTELQDTEIKLDKKLLNFMSEKSAIKAAQAKGLSIDAVSILYEFVIKK